jgi:DNA polymerase/3'-5' exonuclease PolX
MSMQNPEVAEIFKKVADLVELEVERPFKIEAYPHAARTCVGGHSRTTASARG